MIKKIEGNIPELDLFKKVIYVVFLKAEKNNEDEILNLFSNSSITVYHDVMKNMQPQIPFNQVNKKVYVQVCVKIQSDCYINMSDNLLENLKNSFTTAIETNSIFRISRLEFEVDYDSVIIPNFSIMPVKTEWEKINDAQNELIQKLQSKNTEIDYPNIGNTARNAMLLIAEEVFDPIKHNSDHSTNKSDYKNRLYTYIIEELKGKKFKEYRNLAQTAVDFMENSINI
ncbi:MAG: hypothetical protein JXL97_01310 [Bacteroidales bacterium]|nr:hypothetical protein [Bacteroidales bacterium]